MKAIVINSSPNMDNGNTDAILMPFLDGMKEMKAEVEIYYTKKLNIKPCQGEYFCQFKSPGKCIQKDDMEKVLPKLDEADITVFATPLYADGISGTLKILLERILPLGKLSFELRDGHCRHPRRNGKNNGKVALVSTCGFWEMDNFDPILAHIKALSKNMNCEFAGALLRPHAPILKIMESFGAPVNDIFEAAKEAGRQLITEGKISSHLLDTINRPLMPLESYFQRVNQIYQENISSFTNDNITNELKIKGDTKNA